uniref:Putative Bis(5'-nucleosyl)-tetraphosphatase (Symmetrical) n=1 Tax=Magnetococcus massalia (strain MO-1) TaxID=451514 RepID=A0A1S7LKW1_MAGMO|nr:putative Bis(5'-nucleosyl)-tetraphosphatase (Symmetrical) [Candidatus Magnetococcus massalia]
MAVYAIGDIHGCLDELDQLLETLALDPELDSVWFTGDLISRGPDGLGCFRRVMALGESATTLLGNHEVRLLALEHGALPSHEHHWHQDYLDAPDRQEIYQWVRSRKLLHFDADVGAHMVHGGIPCHWELDQARTMAARAERYLQDDDGIDALFETLKSGLPCRDPGEHGNPVARAAFTMTAMTRMRLCDPTGRLVWPKELKALGVDDPYGLPPAGMPFEAWHTAREWQRDEWVIYGHWARAGLQLNHHSSGLDSGCVYGGKLTAMQLDHPDRPLTQISCRGYARVGD